MRFSKGRWPILFDIKRASIQSYKILKLLQKAIWTILSKTSKLQYIHICTVQSQKVTNKNLWMIPERCYFVLWQPIFYQHCAITSVLKALCWQFLHYFVFVNALHKNLHHSGATTVSSKESFAFLQVRLLPLLLLAAHCWGSRQRRESSSFFLNQMPHQFTALKVF